MVAKRKTVAAQRGVGAFAKGTRKSLPKAAAVAEKTQQKKKRGAKEAETEESETEESDVVDPANAQIVAVESKEPTEAEMNASRGKELKDMSAADLKELVTSLGLETGTKETMIKSVLKHEAKLRKELLAQKAKIRAVVTQKKQELEELSTPQLSKLTTNAGLKPLRSKPEQVQRLLLLWQESGGVDQAFSVIAIKERKDQLDSMETMQLRKICDKLALSAYVKEVIAERISRREHEMGCYMRPCIKEPAKTSESNLDMVDALLANEAQRKKDQELRTKREEAIASKRKGLKALSLEELKKLVAKKKLDVGEKKDDMIAGLLFASIQEDLAQVRKSELQSKSIQELNDLLALNDLKAGGGKDKMIKDFLAHEVKINEGIKIFEKHVDEIATKKKMELSKSSNAQLKELCSDRGLPVGGDKEERIERLIEEDKKASAFDAVVSVDMRARRLDALMAMAQPELLRLCDGIEVDPLMKAVMVERVMAFEKEKPSAEQPKTKRARVSK